MSFLPKGWSDKFPNTRGAMSRKINTKPITLPELAELLFRLRLTLIEMEEAATVQLKVKSTRRPKVATKNTREESAYLRRIIVHVLQDHPGLSVGKVAEKAECSTEAARYALALLRDARKVRMAGMRATARWFVK